MEEKKVLLKEADLLDMIGRIIKKKKFVIIVTFCFALFGVIMALSTVRSYTAQVVVAPESSSSSNMGSGLSSLASMVGINMSASGGDDAIYPQLYPDVVRSLPFLTSLFDVEVKTLDNSVNTTYYAYVKNYRKESWLDYVETLPTKTIAGMKMLFVSSEASTIPESEFNPYMLSKKQVTMVEKLNANIGLFVDKKTDVITLSFTDRDPLVAAAMADTIMNRLQQKVTEYRTKKVVDDCKYIEKMYFESKDSLDASQKRYADFVSCNRNVISEHVNIEKEKLEADKELKTTLYTQWAQQLLLAKAKVQESTPVFVTLKPTTVPANASSMSRSMKVILYTFFGALFAVAYILMKEPVYSAWRKIRGKSEE